MYNSVKNRLTKNCNLVQKFVQSLHHCNDSGSVIFASCSNYVIDFIDIKNCTEEITATAILQYFLSNNFKHIGLLQSLHI
jgi:hypothetical protein